jgi:hypothetical protein
VYCTSARAKDRNSREVNDTTVVHGSFPTVAMRVAVGSSMEASVEESSRGCGSLDGSLGGSKIVTSCMSGMPLVGWVCNSGCEVADNGAIVKQCLEEVEH